MKKYSEAFIGFDTAKKKHAVAIANGGRDGEIRYFGEIDSAPATVAKVIGKLAERHDRLHVCYEAGPTGYGLYRQVRALGHDGTVSRPVGSEEARLVALALASVRRTNWTCSFPASSFHERAGAI
jgi:transposase